MARPTDTGSRPGNAPVLGLDVGATKALAVVTEGSHTVDQRSWPTGRDLGPDRLAALLDEVHRWATAGADRAPVAAGIGFPGMVGEGGTVRSSVMVDGWEQVPLQARAQAQLGIPVVVDNDGNCAAVAEHRLRGGTDDLLYISVGTGIGGALVLGGRLWHGVDGLAGEVGHTAGAPGTGPCSCGGRDCLHMVSTSRAIEQALGMAPGGLEHAADSPAGEQRRSEALASSAGAVGVAAASAVNLLAIPLVVIGGGVVRHPGYLDAVRRSVRDHCMAEHARSVRVEAAAAGYSAGAVGAAILAAGNLSGS